MTEVQSEPPPSLSLRERKFARTKLALLEALLDRLKEKSLAEVTVRELCDAVEVSEATFFNYYKKKDDLLRYFIQIWTLEVSLYAAEAAGADGGVAYIEAIFDHTGKRIAENPRVMLEIIGHMALHGDPETWKAEHVPLGPAERLQAFPEVAGVVYVDECEVDVMFESAIRRAIARGELPADADVELAVTAALALFFGTPLWHGKRDPGRIVELYRRELDCLWQGLRRESRQS